MQLFEFLRENSRRFKKSYNVVVLTKTFFMITKACDAEKVLGASRNLERGEITRFFEAFMKKGVFTSNVEKWTQRRKMLTPAFHFTMLKN